MLDTVNKMQGKEADLVIVCLAPFTLESVEVRLLPMFASDLRVLEEI